MKPLLRCCILTLALSLLFCGPALAHKVNIFAYVEAGRVYTESYFPDGAKVEGGKIQVYDSQDKLLLEGRTDKGGLFDFPVPKDDALKIVVNASMGHRNTFTLKKSEVEAGQ